MRDPDHQPRRLEPRIREGVPPQRVRAERFATWAARAATLGAFGLLLVFIDAYARGDSPDAVGVLGLLLVLAGALGFVTCVSAWMFAERRR